MSQKRINISNTSERKQDLRGGKKRRIRNGCLQWDPGDVCVCACVCGVLNRPFKLRQWEASTSWSSSSHPARLTEIAQLWPLTPIHGVYMIRVSAGFTELNFKLFQTVLWQHGVKFNTCIPTQVCKVSMKTSRVDKAWNYLPSAGIYFLTYFWPKPGYAAENGWITDKMIKNNLFI